MSAAPEGGRAGRGFSYKALIIGLVVTLPLLALLYMGLSMDPHRMDAPLVGKPAPPFELHRLSDGQLVSLESLRGKPVILNFWATWCMPCRQEHPFMVSAAKKLGDKIQFVGIVYQDKNEMVNAWLDAYGGRGYPTLIDAGTKTAIAYGVYGVPETYFIDSQGVIRDKVVGPVRPDELFELAGRLQ
ncbi:MAG: redoxin domain-containing protein [Deltaproteobacteria bacterium]|nr:redoxin domain-containing protein [Deltaproteobacteria bacterium]MCB9785462.1 redoxin domain-containing protein [Deltaproteobacteria bacterium]